MSCTSFKLVGLFGVFWTLFPGAVSAQTSRSYQPAIAHQADSGILDGLAQADDESEDSDSEDDFSDDDLDDLLETDEESVGQEKESLRRGDIDDRVGVTNEDILKEEALAQKRLIKTIQQKNFLKLGRFEGTPFLGFVTNDPFINRYILGGSLTYHATEIFALEMNLGYSPDLKEGDWKPLTTQLVSYNNVSPDISKLTLFTNLGFQFSPIYGKVAINGQRIINFDIFGAFGMGTTFTSDNLEALGDDSPAAVNTEFQWHPTTNIGGGARVVFNENLAARLEGRSMIYIETIGSVTLEMKNNFMLLGAVSFFFPNM